MSRSAQASQKIGGDKYDILKFVLSLLIFTLHSDALPIGFRPLQRMAVPLFFITTSYFFFSKLRYLETMEERDRTLARYLKRNFYLLLFWTIVFIVPNAMQRDWLSHPFPYSLQVFLRSLCFGSTFMASWFLSATIIATALLYWAIYKARLSTWLILLLSLLAYLLCCRLTAYRAVFPLGDTEESFLLTYQQYLGIPFWSFPVGLIWIMTGKFIAYGELHLTKRWSAWLSVAGLLLVFLEYEALKRGFGMALDDFMLSLLIVCPCFFQYLVSTGDVSIRHARLLRKQSIVIFCTHGTYLWLFHQYWDIQHHILSAFVMCVLTGMLVIPFASRFSILRYSH